METIYIIIDHSGPTEYFLGAFPTSREAQDFVADKEALGLIDISAFELKAGQFWHSIPDGRLLGELSLELCAKELPKLDMGARS